MIIAIKNKTKSSISLTTVLVIGAMLLLSGITLLTTSLDLLDATSSYSNLKISKINSDCCLEEAMAKIKANFLYTGNGSLSINGGSCTYSVSDYLGSPTNKQIDLSGTLNGTSFIISKVADLTLTPITVSNLN